MSTTLEKAPPKRKRGRQTIYKPILMVKVYKLARAGLSPAEIASAMGVVNRTFFYWLERKPEFREALEMGKEERLKENSLPKYIFGKLSPELKALWQRIKKFEKEKNSTERIEMLLSDNGKRVRQMLFLHALSETNFSVTKACLAVRIHKRELDGWVKEADFAELVSEIEWHKDNFFEDSLMDLISMRVPAAVIYANKTRNKERGYGKRDTLDVNISGSVLHGVMDLSELMPYLTSEGKESLMEALRLREEQRTKAQMRPPSYEEVIEQQVLSLPAS